MSKIQDPTALQIKSKILEIFYGIEGLLESIENVPTLLCDLDSSTSEIDIYRAVPKLEVWKVEVTNVDSNVTWNPLVQSLADFRINEPGALSALHYPEAQYERSKIIEFIRRAI